NPLVRRNSWYQRRDQTFDHRQNVLSFDKRHLEVELREFRLPVTAQVFIAHAARNLKVAFEAGYHQELLELLRTLRQGKEFSLVHAAGNHVVAGSFGCRLDHHGSLDLDEPALVEVVSDKLYRLVTQNHIALHARPPQVEITILQPLTLLR